ncbi:hypothetical protein P20652_0148 [Pseudoalteromonas sp. BSi20652]|nr:hypothetical protein P20652_0148 [Pseudoalteromonas sp. BSi20652]
MIFHSDSPETRKNKNTDTQLTTSAVVKPMTSSTLKYLFINT